VAVSDRPDVVNRDGAYEGIGAAPGNEAVHPKQRFVVRLDLDGPRALRVISGDIYVGPTFKTYEASFVTRQLWEVEPLSENDDALVTGAGRMFEGIAELHGWSSKSKIELRLFLPDEPKAPPRLELKRRFLLSQFPRIYPPYSLDLKPVIDTFPYFRRIELEVAYEAGVPELGVFERERGDAEDPHGGERYTPDLPPTVEQAFAAAGIRIASSVARAAVQEAPAAAGSGEPDGFWNDEELHAAMETLGNVDTPGWRVSLLVVSSHEKRSLAGKMFDSNLGLPRQGAAVFIDSLNEIQGPGAEGGRQLLHTVVHELGHTMNLLHCFQADHSELYRGRARPEALTWMNYPHLYPNGEAQPNLDDWYNEARAHYWHRFGYQFDDDELMHLRHGALHSVMMGGGIESFMKQPPRSAELVTPSVSSGLELDLVLPDNLEFLEQLHGYIRLYNRAAEPRQVHGDLSPSAGYLTIAIRRRSVTHALRHWSTSCVSPFSMQSLEPGVKIYEPLMLSFGDRWYVDQPGVYEFQAVYQPPDGRVAASPVRRVTVGRPWNKEAERSANDFFCNEVGLYLALNGSRSDNLKAKAELLDDLHERFAFRARLPERAVGAQIRCAKEMVATRRLKRPDGTHAFKAGEADAAADAIVARHRHVHGSTAPPKPLNPHVSSVLAAAVKGHARAGSKEKAQSDLKILEEFLVRVGAPPNVLRIPRDLACEWHLKRPGA